jgi:ribosomal protein RSM22 (predicted rRNA methylase)
MCEEQLYSRISELEKKVKELDKRRYSRQNEQQEKEEQNKKEVNDMITRFRQKRAETQAYKLERRNNGLQLVTLMDKVEKIEELCEANFVSIFGMLEELNEKNDTLNEKIVSILQLLNYFPKA